MKNTVTATGGGASGRIAVNISDMYGNVVYFEHKWEKIISII